MKPLITKTFKYRLEPTKEQEKTLDWTLGECWKLNKILLKEKITAYKKKQKQPSQFNQVNSLTKIKEQNPQLKQIFSQILQNIPKQRVPAIWKNFQQRKKINPKAGLPQSKPLHRYHSFTYPQHGFKLEKGQLILSRGQGYPKLRINIRLHTQLKNGKKEGRPLPNKIETCSIFLKNKKWYVCFTDKVEVQQLPKTGKKVGVDMGLDVFCATSDEEKHEIKQFYRKQQEQLTKLARKLSQKKHKRNEEDKTKPSQRYLKIKSKLSKLYEKIANQRTDNAYKLVNYFLGNYDLIMVEKLEIKKMIECRGKYQNLPKSINDAGWKLFLSFLAWKAVIVGKQVVEVNPKNTSKRCFGCGKVKKDLELKDRIFVCVCGYEADRDINAAKNILWKAQATEQELSSIDENMTSVSSLEPQRGSPHPQTR